jgi:hypothetical protein
MKVEIELDNDAETKIIVDSLKWHHSYGEDTPKLRKAFRTVLKYYMTYEEWKEFKEHE